MKISVLSAEYERDDFTDPNDGHVVLYYGEYEVMSWKVTDGSRFEVGYGALPQEDLEAFVAEQLKFIFQSALNAR